MAKGFGVVQQALSSPCKSVALAEPAEEGTYRAILAFWG